MRELRACDFCGEDADGVYEPLPRADDRRRVALCASCRETLESLLAPLTDATRDSARAAADPADAGDSADSTERSSGPEAEPVADEGPDAERSRDDSADGAEPTPPDAAEASDEPADGDANTESNGSDTAEEPPGFRKVMRLLNNRSFPLERAVAVELASGAYDLTDAEVEATLDYAVERGVLVASDGELRRT